MCGLALRTAVEVIQKGHTSRLFSARCACIFWRVANPGSPAPARKLVLRAGGATVWMLRQFR